MKKSIVAVAVSTLSMGAIASQHDHEHINVSALTGTQGKPATEHTVAANAAFAETLNFNDTKVFQDNDRGLIVELDDNTHATLRDRFVNLHEGLRLHDSSPKTVNPSLWRQGQATSLQMVYIRLQMVSIKYEALT